MVRTGALKEVVEEGLLEGEEVLLEGDLLGEEGDLLEGKEEVLWGAPGLPGIWAYIEGVRCRKFEEKQKGGRGGGSNMSGRPRRGKP